MDREAEDFRLPFFVAGTLPVLFWKNISVDSRMKNILLKCLACLPPQPFFLFTTKNIYLLPPSFFLTHSFYWSRIKIYSTGVK